MGYRNIVAKSFFWVGSLRGITLILTLAKFTIAARILGPVGMGIYGIASLVMALLMILTETGISALLVQNENDIKKYIDTYWCVSFLRGMFISLVILIAAKPMSIFFKQPNTYNLILLISLVPLINGFINPSIAKFQKELKFHKEMFYRLPLVFIDSISAIVILYITKNPIALVWCMVISSFFELFISWKFVKPKPTMNIDKSQLRDLFHRGKWITSSGIFTYLFTEGDDWFVGKMLGAANLGIYQLAYKVATLPTYETANIILKISFPTFVKIRGDIKRLRRAYIITTAATAIFIIPYMITVYSFTESIIVTFFGSEWLSAVLIIRIFLLFSALMSLFGLSSGLFLATKKQKYSSNVMFLSVFLMFLSIVPLIYKYGLLGAVYAVLFSWIISCFLNMYYILKVLKYSRSHI